MKSETFAGSPILREGGVEFVLGCRLLEDVAEGGLLAVRDHVVILAEVTDLCAPKRSGLLQEYALGYSHGKYMHFAPVQMSRRDRHLIWKALGTEK